MKNKNYFNNYKENEELEYEEEYSEDDQIDEYEESEEYSEEDIEREQQIYERQEARNAFKEKAKNPFGLRDKMENIDKILQHGSQKTKMLFMLGVLLTFAILFVIVISLK